eukprot:6194940-Pleurochrysis_carterae.AAC.3
MASAVAARARIASAPARNGTVCSSSPQAQSVANWRPSASGTRPKPSSSPPSAAFSVAEAMAGSAGGSSSSNATSRCRNASGGASSTVATPSAKGNVATPRLGGMNPYQRHRVSTEQRAELRGKRQILWQSDGCARLEPRCTCRRTQYFSLQGSCTMDTCNKREGRTCVRRKQRKTKEPLLHDAVKTVHASSDRKSTSVIDRRVIWLRRVKEEFQDGYPDDIAIQERVPGVARHHGLQARLQSAACPLGALFQCGQLHRACLALD